MNNIYFCLDNRNRLERVGKIIRQRKDKNGGNIILKEAFYEKPRCRVCKWSGDNKEVKIVKVPYVRKKTYAGIDVLCPKCGNVGLKKFTFTKKTYVNYKNDKGIEKILEKQFGFGKIKR